MDNIFEIFLAVIFLLFTVFSFVRKKIEADDIERRKQGPPTTVDDLPEETRRMLFGEPAATAKPAAPRRSPDPFSQLRDILTELGQQIEPQTAKPRQGAPRVQPPALPQQPVAAPRRAHPQQPAFNPAQSPRSARPTPAPRPQAQPRHVHTQRPAAPPPPPRMVPKQSEGAMRREQQTDERRFAQQKRRATQPAVRLVEPDEGPTMPFPVSSQKKAPGRRPRRQSRWFSGPDDLRRGIILSEILGPPKALRDLAD